MFLHSGVTHQLDAVDPPHPPPTPLENEIFSNNESAAKLNYVSVELEFKLTPVMIQLPVAPQFSFIRGAMLPISVCVNYR